MKFLVIPLAILGFSIAVRPAFAAAIVVPSYQEADTGNTKAGVGMSCLSGCGGGDASAANQTTGNTSLATIATNTTPIGSANYTHGTVAAMTGTTSTSLIGAPGAALYNYITQLICVNSHATVGTFVSIQDGSGGTVFYTLAAASAFGGSAITFSTPLKQPTANTALYVADVTTGANVICSATGYKGS